MIYLDNAATSMRKPEEVIRAVTDALQTMGNAGRGAHQASMTAARGIFGVRQQLADFFHAGNASRISFTANSTESLNIAVKGLLLPGDHVITTVLEHNSVLRPLYEMQERGVDITCLDCDETGMVYAEDFEKAVRDNTRAIICTHGSNLTGNLLDAEEIGAVADRHGLLFILDASQTAGIFDIDVEKMKVDVLCFTGHKGLLGPQGTGGIYVREGLRIRPLKSGGSGIRTFDRAHPDQMPEALEAGTLNGPGICGLGAALSYIERVGTHQILRQEEALMRAFYREIKDIPGIRIYGNFRQPHRCPIVTFNIGEEDSALVAGRLYDEYDICVRAGGHCAPLMHQALGTRSQGAVRTSFSHYNTMDEVMEAAAAVREESRLYGR